VLIENRGKFNALALPTLGPEYVDNRRLSEGFLRSGAQKGAGTAFCCVKRRTAMARKPPRQNLLRDFLKEAHKCPVVVIATLPNGTVRTETCAIDDTKMTDVMRVLLKREFDRQERQNGVAFSARSSKPKHSAGSL
jgi:hypothetical protein